MESEGSEFPHPTASAPVPILPHLCPGHVRTPTPNTPATTPCPHPTKPTPPPRPPHPTPATYSRHHATPPPHAPPHNPLPAPGPQPRQRCRRTAQGGVVGAPGPGVAVVAAVEARRVARRRLVLAQKTQGARPADGLEPGKTHCNTQRSVHSRGRNGCCLAHYTNAFRGVCTDGAVAPKTPGLGTQQADQAQRSFLLSSVSHVASPMRLQTSQIAPWSLR